MKAADITVHLESPFLDRLEQLAQLSGKSVAEVVELYIKVQMGWRPVSGEVPAAVQALAGSVPLPPDWDYKTARDEALTRKYGR
ncbi:DUF6364 family protein [Hymenobacter sp. M29]|uniref:DUF6364 family protein n=1 Tax=Hymenobacter mellowenesis TaxID=3063995 RepID=A0ABT9ACL7_9BACT|nr:DUF6364 family protein [Hymenobacter sp. M29]MDO7846920.1 DUF6364 family protein [Hymenobacter sp. M29]